MISLGLRYFLEVARCGSIAGAAAAQHVAASAVSRQIAKLEDGLGIALFERQARGMELSEAGRQLAAYANAAALEAERVTIEIRQRGHLGDVTIRLACTEGFAHRFLPMCMAEFKRVRPEARFHLHVERPEEVSRQILEGLSQLALRYTTAQDDRLKTELLVRAPVYAVMCRNHPLASRRSLGVRDLTKVPLSLGDHGTTVRQLFDAACANAGLHIEPAYVSNHSAAFLPMLPGSDIVALSGYLTVLGQRDGEGLVAVPFSNPEMRQRSIQVLTLQGRTLPALAREFLEFMAQRLTATPKAPEG
jgi:DNA-binding transcriptional LysR family regulator